jgi:hypothetical protein
MKRKRVRVLGIIFVVFVLLFALSINTWLASTEYHFGDPVEKEQFLLALNSTLSHLSCCLSGEMV